MATGVFESESLYHMLMSCQHASMRDLRTRLRDVKNLCQMDVDPQSPEPPEFAWSYDGLSEMWAVMMLCTTATSFPLDLPSFLEWRDIRVPISEEATKMAKEIRARLIIYSRDGVLQASSWIYAVMGAWRSNFATTMCQERRRQ